jgi:serine protease AprX
MTTIATTRRRGGLALLAFALSLAGLQASAAAARLVSVVATSSSVEDAAGKVSEVGGDVVYRIPLIEGVVARVPEDRIAQLAAVTRIAPDVALHVQSASFGGDVATAYPSEVGATEVWPATDGSGVGVALVDTGVADVPDLAGRVVASADLSSELSFSDTYGHGTFMAGLIAGSGASSGGRYVGVAPGAHLVSLKVAGADGSTSLGRVLYALQLVDHSRVRFNVRVLLLALSSGSDLAPNVDPLTIALRELWLRGVFVVVPAGNEGPAEGSVTSPGVDPALLTVGAVDDRGTGTVSDDLVPEWTGRGPTVFGAAKPEVAAPGAHLVSVRAPGSTVDDQNPSARVEDAYFKGSGTSMAAAVTVGVAALVISSNPLVGPDEVKRALSANATGFDAPQTAVGSGVVNASRAVASVSGVTGTGASWKPGTRPSPPPGVPGDFDWYGDAQIGYRWLARQWHASEWAARAWDARAWDAHDFAARQWDDARWDARQWDARQWGGRVWDGRTWDARQWDARQWDARQWDGRTWDGRSWDGRSWDGRSWDGRSWDGRSWDGRTWESRSWDGRSWDGRTWESRSWDGRSWEARSWEARQWSALSWD